MGERKGNMKKSVRDIRWTARGLSLLLVAFALFMFIGESMEERPTRHPIEAWAVLFLSLMGFYLFAMLVALRWERSGVAVGTVALGAALIMLVVRDGVSPLLNPFMTMFCVPPVLYAVCWLLERRGRLGRIEDGAISDAGRSL